MMEGESYIFSSFAIFSNRFPFEKFVCLIAFLSIRFSIIFIVLVFIFMKNAVLVNFDAIAIEQSRR